MRTAIPCPAGRPESAIPCSPPTDPAGFIYPSYRAAQTETQRGEPFLPVQWETVEVGLRDAYKIRRVYRKLAKRKGSGSLRRMTVFVRHENVVRLLGFLGYCLE
jgi:hypothetical protein